MNKKPKVIVITGPTSSGKSDVAICLAKKFDGEIISADSRQVYHDMNLGTGKVEGEWEKHGERKNFVSEGIFHHIIDFRSPRGEYNVSHFQKDCTRKIKEISALGKVPIICGGTSFWIFAIASGAELPNVKPNLLLRKELGNQSTTQLFVTLRKLDLERASGIDQHNRQRLVRAIEICKQLGKVPKPKIKKPNFDTLIIGLNCSKEDLERKIQKRLNKRFVNGMVDEVEMLKKKYHLSWKKIQSFGLAYFWIPLFLQGKIDEKELRERVFLAERNYAKRQRTWLKKESAIKWLKNYDEIKKEARKFLK